jgi:cell wall-associated NlpC family hydrolase
MTSPALVDLWSNTRILPPREKLIAVARLMVGTPHQYGDKSAKPIDGIISIAGNKIDCSGFVRAVYSEVFPEEGLDSRDDLNALKFQTEDLFKDVEQPLAGDIICWDGHVGIVYDPDAKTFIGAQTSTGVRVANYQSGYWATTKVVKKFRRWKSLS